jgi:hypothetical protein
MQISTDSFAQVANTEKQMAKCLTFGVGLDKVAIGDVIIHS